MSSKWVAATTIVLATTFGGMGCQSSGGGETGLLRSGIPPKAQQVQEGSGQLVHVADQPGRLYLYDATNDTVVERYQVRRGQRFAVDAAAGRATLDGNEVSVGKLKKGATYQMFFLPENAQ